MCAEINQDTKYGIIKENKEVLKMVDFKEYKKNKLHKELKEHNENFEKFLQEEKQLELYESNTGKTNIQAHMELAKKFHDNAGAEHQPITAAELAADFDFL